MPGLRTAVILVLGLLLLAAGAAQAQTEVNLVSNTGQGHLGSTNFTRDAAQAFTTGNHAPGYQLKKVVMFARSTGGQPTYTAALHANTRLNNHDRPGTRLGTLSNPALTEGGSLVQLNLTTAGITLDANTTYWVVIDASSGTANHSLGTTASTGEDSGAAAGWSISNSRLTRLNNSSTWGGTATEVYRIAVHGEARPATVKLMSNTGQGQTDDTSFLQDYAQQFTTGTHAPGYRLESLAMRLWKRAGAAEPAYTVSIHTNTTNVSNNDVPADTSLGTLTNPNQLSTTEDSEVTFTAPSGIDLNANTKYWVVLDVSSGNADQRAGRTEADGEDAGTAPGWSMGNSSLRRNSTYTNWATTNLGPSLRIAMHGYAKAPTVSRAVVSGTRLMLTFSEPLDSDATPAASAFSVTVASVDRTVNAVVVSGSIVTLTLASAVTTTDTMVKVGYTAPTSGSTLQLPSALGGTTVATFSAQDATNLTGTPDISGVALVSTPSRDTDGTPDTYVLTDRIEVQVTFDEAVTVTGTPRLEIMFDPAFGKKWADYTSGSGTTALTFAYTVVAGNFSSRGVAVLVDTLELNSGTIKATAAGTTDAILNHPGLAHDPAHKVNATRLPASLVSNAEQGGPAPATSSRITPRNLRPAVTPSGTGSNG